MTLALILFSFKSIIIKTALSHQVQAQDLIFWRLLLAVPIAWGAWFFLDKNRSLKLSLTEGIAVFCMGAVGIFLSLIGSYSALQYIDASVSVVVVYCQLYSLQEKDQDDKMQKAGELLESGNVYSLVES